MGQNNSFVYVNVQAPEHVDPEPEGEPSSDSDFEVVAPSPVAPSPARLRNFAFVPSILRQPVRQRPTVAELRDQSVRFFVVWLFPGQDWTGIHWGRGATAWQQFRSYAAVHHSDLTPPAAFRQIRWYRAYGCNHQQLEAAFRREAPAGLALEYYLGR